MRLLSQPGTLRHHCDKCVRFIGDRSVSVVVIDGITLGHPCCAMHNCHIPLSNNRNRFCDSHVQHSSICAIVGCSSPVAAPERKTCDHPDHRAVELMHIERGQSRFQLQERHERARLVHPNDSLGVDGTVSESAGQEPPDLDAETEEFTIAATALVPKKLRAQFGRKRTHNEQIIVAPCGMIVSRATFYGAEAVSSVVVSVYYFHLAESFYAISHPFLFIQEFVKQTYQAPEMMPNHVFFDNNCQLSKVVKHDPFFKNVGLSVDVFHFKSKHKVTDTYCQQHCNPVQFPELKGEGNKPWYFNSSIAEQTNVWLGGYLAICREMLVDRYNFFLDEMILRRNRITLAKLEQSGCKPGTFPL